MADPRWRDHHLSDIIEAQFVLFCHLTGALDRAGLVPRDFSAQTLRETAANDALRPGVRSCLCAIAELLEQDEPGDAGPAWEPRVVTGGAGPDGPAGETVVPEAGPGNGHAENGKAEIGRARNGRTGNGAAGNGSRPAGWRPTLVGDDDPDCA